MGLKSLYIPVAFLLATAQGAPAQAPAPQKYDVPFAPVHSLPLTQSLPRLVTEGWQIVAVSYNPRTFAYHLVRQGALALCLVELGRVPPGTECIQIIDGAAPSAENGAPPP